jgi:hypothetical protein
VLIRKAENIGLQESDMRPTPNISFPRFGGGAPHPSLRFELRNQDGSTGTSSALGGRQLKSGANIGAPVGGEYRFVSVPVKRIKTGKIF